MLLTLKIHTNELMISSADLPAWLSLLGKANAVRSTGYADDKKSVIVSLNFSIEPVLNPTKVEKATPEVGTDPA